MKESGIQRAICEYLAVKKHFFWRSNTIGVFDTSKKTFRRMPKFALSGVPDIILIHKGKFVGLEVKNEKGRPSPKQLEFELKCKRAGGEYYIVRSIQDVQDLGL